LHVRIDYFRGDTSYARYRKSTRRVSTTESVAKCRLDLQSSAAVCAGGCVSVRRRGRRKPVLGSRALAGEMRPQLRQKAGGMGGIGCVPLAYPAVGLCTSGAPSLYPGRQAKTEGGKTTANNWNLYQSSINSRPLYNRTSPRIASRCSTETHHPCAVRIPFIPFSATFSIPANGPCSTALMATPSIAGHP
jgi:hypothetical protein